MVATVFKGCVARQVKSLGTGKDPCPSKKVCGLRAVWTSSLEFKAIEHHMKAKSDHRAGLVSPLIGNVRSFEILVAYHKIKIKQWGFNPQLRTLLYANSL